MSCFRVANRLRSVADMLWGNLRDATFGRMGSLLDWLARSQARAPKAYVAAVLVVSALFGVLAAKLELRTRFDQMLPDAQPGVLELRRVEQRTKSGQMVVVVLEGEKLPLLRAMADALAVKIRASSTTDTPLDVSSGMQQGQAFLKPRSGLFAKLPELEKLAQDIERRWDWEVTRATGNDLLDDGEPPKIDEKDLRNRFGLKDGSERFPDGYFQSKDGKTVLVIVKTQIRLGDLGPAERTKASVERAVAELNAPAQGVRIGLTGDLITGLTEYGRARTDLLEVGALGIGLVLISVLIYFMRLRALLVLGATILCGLAVTFGITYLVIGHLNVATGFLFSIVAGNGINVGILYLARYYEERRNGLSAPAAVLQTHLNTWKATLLAALVSGAAYMSLSVSEFKAFRHFAFIGASGMLACWVVTLCMLPALLVIFDAKTDYRESALRAPRAVGQAKSNWLSRLRITGIPFGPFFVQAVERMPRVWIGLGAAVLVFGCGTGVLYVKNNPMEYDLRKTQNDPRSSSELYRLSDVAKGILGEYKSSMLVLCDSAEDARALSKTLETELAREAAPGAQKRFEAAHSIFEFLPEKQVEKLEVLQQIRERLVRSHEKGYMTDEEWKRTEPFLPSEGQKPFGLTELPEDLASSFTDRAGNRGTLVLVEPNRAADEDDLRYLIRYADAFRETRLPNGTLVRGSGRATIFADILKAVVNDIPRALGAAVFLTFAAIVVFFRKRAYLISVALSLLVGIAGVALYMWASGTKINFLNFAALPITLAIGADYSINVMQRYAIERSDEDGEKIGFRPSLPPSMPVILRTLRTTGGAVALCSLTTLLGYLALIRSENLAIASLGKLAVIGEISCLSAAVLSLPAAWLLIERSKRQ
jgi:uncharacterized protein